MNKLFILLAGLAFMHVARPQENQPCTANGKTYNLNDRICADEYTYRICDYGGKWFDAKCPSGLQCQLQEGSDRRSQCQTYIHAHAESGSRFRRDDASRQDSPPKSSDTCSANGQTYQLNDWICADDNTHRLCDWGGKWLDRQCPEGFKCKPIAGSEHKIQCFQYNKVEYATGPPAGAQNSDVQAQNQGSSSEVQAKSNSQGNHFRFRRDDASRQDSPPTQDSAPKSSDTCSANGQTYQLNDWICADDTTHRLCDWGGKWLDRPCPEGFKCKPLKGNKVQCLQYNKVEYATGPPAGAQNSDVQSQGSSSDVQAKPSQGNRFRRDDASRQDSPPTQDSPPKSSDTCSANGQTYQLNDWICADDTTHRLCDWGGKWLDRPCPEGFKCKPLKGNKVQCFQYNKVEYATGPPAGAQNSDVQGSSSSESKAQNPQ